MEIKVNAELIIELKSKIDWINKIPESLPEKRNFGETFLFVDKNGDFLETGRDFIIAEEKKTFPVKVYRKILVSK